MAKLVRLKRLIVKKGHIIRRYTAFSTTFEETKGWYRVSDDVAAYLATVHQVPNDEDTPLAFEVCTEKEARRIDAVEKKQSEQRAHARTPNVARSHEITARGDLTTADLRDPNRRRRAAAGERRA